MNSTQAAISTKLVRQGEDALLVLDAKLLKLLKIDENTPLNVVTDGSRIIIEPAGNQDRAALFTQAVTEADKQYSNMFKRLAQ